MYEMNKNIMKKINIYKNLHFAKKYRIILFLNILFIVIFFWLTFYEFIKYGISQNIANKDFANYWTASRLIISGQIGEIFGPWHLYFGHMQDHFGQDYPWHNWSYPPHYLFFILPLGFLGYKLSMLVFLFLTGILFLYYLKLYARENIDWAIFVSIPFILLNIFVAQNGFLTGGLALGALALRGRRPILAGILLGALTVKPQLGILFPVLLLAERRWRVIISAAISSISLVALSALVFGTESWSGYLQHVIPYQTMVLREFTGTFHTMMPSLYGLARRYGVDADPAFLMHALIAVPVTVTTIWALFRLPDARAREAIMLTATFIVSPYAFNYDFGLLIGALVVLAPDRDQFLRESLVARSVIGAAILLPAIMMPLGQLGVQIGPPVLLGLFALILFVFSDPSRSAPPHDPARAAGR